MLIIKKFDKFTVHIFNPQCAVTAANFWKTTVILLKDYESIYKGLSFKTLNALISEESEEKISKIFEDVDKQEYCEYEQYRKELGNE